jgi:hypothetical protein
MSHVRNVRLMSVFVTSLIALHVTASDENVMSTLLRKPSILIWQFEYRRLNLSAELFSIDLTDTLYCV